MKNFSKSIYTLLFLLGANIVLLAQVTPPDNWFLLDPSKDGVNGLGANKAYETLLKGKESLPILVAVLDSGVDYNHDDLKEIMWINPKEIAGNGIDDDKNGYIDDIHGWNFLGGKDGRSLTSETLEMTRVYKQLKDKFKGKTEANLSSAADKADYKKMLEFEKKINEKLEEAQGNIDNFDKELEIYTSLFDALTLALGDKPLTVENLKAINDNGDKFLALGKRYVLEMLENGANFASVADMRKELTAELGEALKYYQSELEHYNVNSTFRQDIVKDDPNNPNERNYGNPNVMDFDGHGTHVAGIIGAKRGNDIGIDGVANNVKIMAVRCVPDGDERDKDVANAIRYAVDNGAKVINMSFGKGLSPDKKVVDDAVKYAQKMDVLLVHAAGNDGSDNDKGKNFPTDKFEKKGLFGKKYADNWLEVGALSWKKGENLPANFSNYGADQVDVFSPGVDILSTELNNTYLKHSGTSMASPAAAGLAAMLRSYYPDLSAKQVKEIMMNSAVQSDEMVNLPGSKGEKKVKFSTLCKAGGYVNASKAIELASKTKGNSKFAKKSRV